MTLVFQTLYFEDLAVGMALAVSWEPLSDGRHYPLFAPAGDPT